MSGRGKKTRNKQSPRRPAEVGSPAWLREMAAQLEAGLMASEHNVARLAEAVESLRAHEGWQQLLAEPPQSWQRLIAEWIDPRHQRAEWIEAIADGYFKLRSEGHTGRITRRAAEHAAGYRHPHSEVVERLAPAPSPAPPHGKLEPVAGGHGD